MNRKKIILTYVKGDSMSNIITCNSCGCKFTGNHKCETGDCQHKLCKKCDIKIEWCKCK